MLGKDKDLMKNETLTASEYLNIPIEIIDPNPWQPRQDFDPKSLQDLAASLAQDGILQPLVVARNPMNASRYFVIAGERRLRAAKLAGLMKVPVHLKTVDMEADDHLRVALIENIQRSNLNVVEEAKAYRCLIDQFGYTQEDCAHKVGKDRTTIANALRILTLPEDIHDDIVNERLSSGHARAIAGLNDPVKIRQVRDWILKKRLNVRETESLCKKMKFEGATRALPQVNADLNYIAETLRSILHAQVSIKGTMQKGRIELSYFSQEEFQTFLVLLGYDSAAN